MTITPLECPACKSNLDRGAIPEDKRQHYAPPYRWSRAIGISDGDRIIRWMCPDCMHEWSRDLSDPTLGLN